MSGSVRQRPVGYTEALGASTSIGVNGDDDPFLKRESSDHHGWTVAAVILWILIGLATLIALTIAIIAVIQRHDTHLVSSLGPDDTLVLGDDTHDFVRIEAGCAVTTRISEIDISESPGLSTLRSSIFDLAACTPGGFTHAPPFVGFGCASITLPPGDPVLPSSGGGCPFGMVLFGTYYSTGGAVVPSDERVKEQIESYEPRDALAVIKRLHPKKYYHTEEYFALTDAPYRYHRHGFISQEVEQVLPGAVRTVANYTVSDETVLDNFKLLDKDALIVELVGAVQALDSKIADLHDRLEAIGGS